MFKKNLVLVALTSAMIIALLGRVIAAHHETDKPSEISKLAYQTIKSMNMKQAWVDILPDMVDLMPASMFQTMESQGTPAELIKKLENGDALEPGIVGGETLWAYFCRKLARAEKTGDPRLATEPVLIV